MDINKTLDELLGELNKLIDTVAKDKSPEVQETVAKLSEVDVKLKHAIEELEKLDKGDVETHNELAEKLDKLLDEIVAQKKTEKEEEPEEPEPEEKPKHIVVHIKGVILRPNPMPFFPPFPFFW